MPINFNLPLQSQPWVADDRTLTREAYVFMTNLFSAAGNGQTLGTASLQNIGTSGANVPLLSGANEWSNTQLFDDGDLRLKGSISGQSILKAPASGGGTITFPTGAGTVLIANQTITLSGDVTGSGTTSITATVAQINGVGLGSTTATAGNLLIGSGTQWVTHAVTGDWTITSGGVATVAKVNGVFYPAAPSTNRVPVVTGSNTITYEVCPVAAGGTGVASLPVSSQSSPSDPVGTTDTTGKMMGLAGSITPAVRTKALVIISGTIFNATAIADGGKVQIRFGTGAAPSNGDALTGTAAGGLVQYITATTLEKAPFSLNAVISGLTPATAYWIDVGLAAITGGTATISDVSVSAVEIT